jgi:AbrB family looped-hinge helix DNA binding protein
MSTSNLYAHVQVSSNGRIIIPAELRKSAHIDDGDTIIMTLHDGGVIKIQSMHESINEAKMLVKKRFSKEDLSTELKKMRIADFGSENV